MIGASAPSAATVGGRGLQVAGAAPHQDLAKP